MSWAVYSRAYSVQVTGFYIPSYLSSLLYNAMFSCPPDFCHTCYCCDFSSSTSLHCSLTFLVLYLSHFFIKYLFLIVVLETSVCLHVCMYVCMHACMCSCTYGHMWSVCAYMCTGIYMSMCVHVGVCVYVCMCTYEHVYVCVLVYTCACVCI